MCQFLKLSWVWFISFFLSSLSSSVPSSLPLSVSPSFLTPFLPSFFVFYTREKDSLFKKWHGENWTAACKRMTLNHYLTTYKKSIQNWLKISHINVYLNLISYLFMQTVRTLEQCNSIYTLSFMLLSYILPLNIS